MHNSSYLLLVAGVASIGFAQVNSPSPTPAILPPATLIRKVDPGYSLEARNAKLQGTVSLYMEIGADGKPSLVDVIQGLGLGLDQMAVDAVQRWQYQPNPNVSHGPQDAFETKVNFQLQPPAVWRVASEAFWFPGSQTRTPQMSKPGVIHFTPPSDSACNAPDGRVTVDLEIDNQGIPSPVKSESGAHGVDTGMVEAAIRTWRFHPATAAGNTVRAAGEVQLECNSGGYVPDSGAESDPYLHTGPITPARVTHQVSPEYSDEARQAKYQGTALLSVTVATDGRPSNIRVVRRLGIGLDARAVEAVQLWRFIPAQRGGAPVATQLTIEVSFHLI